MAIPVLQPDDKPVVGQKYKVLCLRFKKAVHNFGRGWIPIVGPAHSDPGCVNFSLRHYHPDVRFLSPRQLSRVPGQTTIEKAQRAFGQVLTIVGPDAEHDIRLIGRVCHRELPEWKDVQFVRCLEEEFKDHALKDCLVCPHRGIHLKPYEDEEGFAQCPGHGLVWNLREKRLATPEEALLARRRAHDRFYDSLEASHG